MLIKHEDRTGKTLYQVEGTKVLLHTCDFGFVVGTMQKQKGKPYLSDDSRSYVTWRNLPDAILRFHSTTSDEDITERLRCMLELTEKINNNIDKFKKLWEDVDESERKRRLAQSDIPCEMC